MTKSKRKVKLAFIEDETARKTTFKKRQKGLLKKVFELSTLCDVKTCAIIYSPYDGDAEMWPSKQGVNDVVSMFKMLSEIDQNKRKTNLLDFVWQRFKKSEEKLKKLVEENQEMSMREFMFDCMKGDMFKFRYGLNDMLALGSYIDKYIEDCNRMINITSEGRSSSSSSAPVLTGFHDQIRQNQPEQNQFPAQMLTGFTESVPLGFYDQFHQNMNQNLAPLVASNGEFSGFGFHDHFNQQQNQNLVRSTALAPNLAPMAATNGEFSSLGFHDNIHQYQNQNLMNGIGGVASSFASMAATNAGFGALGFDNQYQNMNQNQYPVTNLNPICGQMNSYDQIRFGNHDMNLGQIYNENQQQWMNEFMEDHRQIENGGELLGFPFVDNSNF